MNHVIERLMLSDKADSYSSDDDKKGLSMAFLAENDYLK